MTNKIKRLISILLVTVLFLLTIQPAFATGNKRKIDDYSIEELLNLSVQEQENLGFYVLAEVPMRVPVSNTDGSRVVSYIDGTWRVLYTKANGLGFYMSGTTVGIGPDLIKNVSAHDSGEILLNGTPLENLDETRLAQVRSKKLGFVFQDFCLLDGLTVFENICIPKIILHSPYKPMEAKAHNLMELFDITDIADKYPAEISGGQKQRTAVARALMNHPDLILADEPTGNLDSRSGAAVIGAFREAKEKLDATIFMVTHDSFSASHCDRVLLMRDGQVQKELKRQGSRREFMDILLDELKQLNERM